MIRSGLLALLVIPPLAGCGPPSGPPLVSASYPPNAQADAAQPQPLGSLPPGAFNPGAGGLTTNTPLATHPNYGSFGAFTIGPRPR